ncbi:MAG: hypothetical protein KME20_05465 [Kaiparowitsia implicata GSE-PSE-MK54-09C]|jgi:hypothetical protein|nr:hypothetical protein [Kaiparowitsia implicata GSE-PSE-MK54-09C]
MILKSPLTIELPVTEELRVTPLDQIALDAFTPSAFCPLNEVVNGLTAKEDARDWVGGGVHSMVDRYENLIRIYQVSTDQRQDLIEQVD